MPSTVPFERTASGVAPSAPRPSATSSYAGSDFTRSGSMPAASTISGSGRKCPDAVTCHVHGTTVRLKSSSRSPRSNKVPKASNAMAPTSTGRPLPGFHLTDDSGRVSHPHGGPPRSSLQPITRGAPSGSIPSSHGRNDDTHLVTGDSSAYPPAGQQPSPGGSPPPQDCIPRRMDRAVGS